MVEMDKISSNVQDYYFSYVVCYKQISFTMPKNVNFHHNCDGLISSYLRKIPTIKGVSSLKRRLVEKCCECAKV